jgi:hypothetical protein
MSLFGAVRLLVEAGTWAEPRIRAVDGAMPLMRPGAWARWWGDSAAGDEAGGDGTAADAGAVGEARFAYFAVLPVPDPSGRPRVADISSEDEITARLGRPRPDVLVIDRVSTRSGVHLRIGAGSPGGRRLERQ